ncbi:mitochondrial ribosomal protein L55 [Nomia melanderi]|uniref:mitochondrial ribosomal protein L55 n=1 Tax=Nomia melanderi TaxID=2448451 RepID=UPI0013041074|nr:39S ribosomal protein L55, mitochondrial [Nomia melanderi]XP_031827280.1 39S ribosomal protein L55, mitochondrial [Nomia melanderi]
MNVSSLLRTTLTALTIRRSFNCWTAGITKKHRKIYENTYPTNLVFPNGSSIIIDQDSPREIITLPIHFEELSAEEREMRLQRRKPKYKVEIEEYEDIDFDETKYYRKNI